MGETQPAKLIIKDNSETQPSRVGTELSNKTPLEDLTANTEDTSRSVSEGLPPTNQNQNLGSEINPTNIITDNAENFNPNITKREPEGEIGAYVGFIYNKRGSYEPLYIYSATTSSSTFVLVFRFVPPFSKAILPSFITIFMVSPFAYFPERISSASSSSILR